MNGLIKLAIKQPIAVAAMVFLIIAFGLVALQKIPIQMTPDIDKPILQVRVSWPGASPEDVEREVVTRLELAVASLSGIENVESDSRFGSGRVTLTYSVGQDMDIALIQLLSKVSAIDGLPSESKRPTVRTSNSDDSPISRLAMVKLPNSEVDDLASLGDFVEFEIIEKLSRIEGISEITFRGGEKKELKVAIDTQRLAEFSISIPTVLEALRASSAQVTAGEIIEGKRTYSLRAEAISYTPNTAKNIVLRSETGSDGIPVNVRLEDVAKVYMSYKKPTSFRRMNGQDAITFAVIREPNSNVVEIIDNLKIEIEKLNKGVLSENGLILKNVYDETVYINAAIALVQQNIIIGGILAICILMLFLRSFRPTLIIMLAIPVSVIGTFVAISWLGLSVNVISLAGLAFAVGMVVDASIVSQENIYRLRQSGMSPIMSSYQGARQVWAPILGSALTTVVVFIPILLIELPIGQLFRDIGIAISVSVLISVFISITLIPTIASKLLSKNMDGQKKTFSILFLDSFASKFAKLIQSYALWSTKSLNLGLSVVLGLIVTAGSIIFYFLPPLDYLPDGNRNFVFARIMVPPGYNKEATVDISRAMERAARPLWEAESDGPYGKPKIDRFFFVAYSGGAFAGAATEDPKRVKEILPVLTKPIRSQPGARAFAQQASLFGRSVGGARVIKLEITGPSLDLIQPTAQKVMRAVRSQFPPSQGHQIRSVPQMGTGSPQVMISPIPEKLANIGMSARDFAQSIDVYNDSVRVREIPFEGKLIDLVLTSDKANISKIDNLKDLPLITKTGELVRLSQVADIKLIGVPEQIKRLSGRRVITLQLRPHESISLEDAVLKLQNSVVTPISKDMQEGVSINLSGAASELERTWVAMKNNVLIALFVIFLLLTVLMRSFILPLVIMITVPIAGAGGVIALVVLNKFQPQPLDMLTMLGFIILAGIVVNNSILMVEQTLWHIRYESMKISEAITEATRNRIRPIFMSTLTSLFGLIPLVIFPGSGSELYRGIGTVVFGGLASSAILTLLMVPPLLAIALKTQKVQPVLDDKEDLLV
ncbi:efflux RND transporter permease subunit [Alphaproteobacteria bacterium]|jgi:HAE1 family hydrophobic/amphiphilic exporter-1|nr:efflux RND transporter permease subunit [Alphaproteobacteria bacterium]